MGKTVITAQGLSLRGQARDKAGLKFQSAATSGDRRQLLVSPELQRKHPGVVEVLRWCASLERSKWGLLFPREPGAAGSRDVALNGLGDVVAFLKLVRKLESRRGLDDPFFGIPAD